MERYKDLNTQLKLAKAFKAIISAGLVAPVFVSVSACEKAKPVVEEAEKTAVETTAETTAPVETTTQETTQETTPPTTEVVETGPIEYEGVLIEPIEGLRFDNGTFFAVAGNPYGLEAEAKAGIFVKEAFEFNKEKINSIAFCPEVIDFWQHKFFDEKGKIFLPVPLDPIQAKGAQIDVVDKIASTSLDRTGGTSLLINAPIGTKIYAPLKTELREDYWLWRTGTSFVPDPCGRKDGLSDKNSYQVSFPLEPFFNPNKINYEGFDFEVFEDIDNVGIKMSLQGVSPLPPLADAEVNYLDINTNNYIQADEFDSLQKEGHLIISFRLISMNLGEPVVEIIAEPYESPKFSGLCSAEIFFDITLLSQNKDLVLGDESVMMELSGSKVSILPVQ